MDRLSPSERERIVERVGAGLERARTQGKRFGRPRASLPIEHLRPVAHLSLTDAAGALGISRDHQALAPGSQNPLAGRLAFASIHSHFLTLADHHAGVRVQIGPTVDESAGAPSPIRRLARRLEKARG